MKSTGPRVNNKSTVRFQRLNSVREVDEMYKGFDLFLISLRMKPVEKSKSIYQIIELGKSDQSNQKISRTLERANFSAVLRHDL